MKDALIVTLLSVVPKGLGSRLQGAVGRLGLSRHLIAWYARTYGVNTEEMVGRIEDYDSLQSFFVRALKPGARPIDEAPEALVSPCDARVYAFGTLTDDGELPEDAGIWFDVSQLIGGDERYRGGGFAVLYLSPRDYHRVHHPREGQVVGLRYLPGQLWPVFDEATRRVPGLFAINERMAVFVDAEGAGRVAVVMVGAYGVGRMSLAWSELESNVGQPAAYEGYNPPLPAERGAELGRFNLGSTVILVTEPGVVRWELEVGQAVKVGQRIAKLGPFPELTSPEDEAEVIADDAGPRGGEPEARAGTPSADEPEAIGLTEDPPATT
ncbi:MAG: phosphatidylserine decarboxylase [Alphaproteobacteria bacterium]|nr:phosphatidylserine decarboxylase [Alphaproteobacteria bacterium]MCB9796254.1 phosphatidylserine decarboxylase [Alphaproteobacteria bacterium]